ncbi:AraC family transcriptional regulator [Pontibacillus salicampi]|uniref:AraC family transcriptional regulator n=1 Tax=Pontibacillus salicampi TaxID=1449801 RepID=A0ABV6LTY5_9BACI
MEDYRVCFDTNQKLAANKFKMGYQLETNKHNWTLHSHKGYEIYFFYEGKANYLIENKVYQIQPGDMLLLNGETIHGVNPEKGVYRRSFINFLPEFLEGTLEPAFYERVKALFNQEGGKLIRWGLEECDRVDTILADMNEEKLREQAGYQAMITSSLVQLLVKIYRKAALYEGRSSEGIWRQRDNHVERTLTYVNTHYMKDMTLDQIAVDLHLNKYYMCHYFKEVTGISVKKYLTKRRMEEAKKLLLTSEQSIESIAFTIGLNGHVQLSRLFKQYNGTTPVTFRKQHGKADPNVT